jgi:hypothetical protein
LAPRRHRRGTGVLWPAAGAPMRSSVVSAFASCGNYGLLLLSNVFLSLLFCVCELKQ